MEANEAPTPEQMNLKELGEHVEDKAVEYFNIVRLEDIRERLLADRKIPKLTIGGLIQAINGLHRQLRAVVKERDELRSELERLKSRSDFFVGGE
jgi:hypothetical protein